MKALDLNRQGEASRRRGVHDMIMAVGGYWRPLAGVARVLEEVGELAELLEAQTDGANQDLDGELADLWIIVAAIGNQFLVYDEGKDRPSEATAPETTTGAVLLRLLDKAGHLARAANYYDGPKTPRSFDQWAPVRESVPQILSNVRQLADLLAIDLDSAVDRKLVETRVRDQGRFTPSYDPGSSPVLEQFRQQCKSTSCPYFGGARLWAAPAWDTSASIADNVDLLVQSLVMFCKATVHEQLDGYVIALDDQAPAASFRALSRAFAELLGLLVDRDPKPNGCLDNDIDIRGWQFQFHDTRLFTTVHSSLYPTDHIRHSDSGTFILLQPETSFDHYGIGGNFAGSGQRKQRVRAAFGHLRYPGDLIDLRIEARLYVLSNLQENEQPYIEWWRDLPDGETTSKVVIGDRRQV